MILSAILIDGRVSDGSVDANEFDHNCLNKLLQKEALKSPKSLFRRPIRFVVHIQQDPLEMPKDGFGNQKKLILHM